MSMEWNVLTCFGLGQQARKANHKRWSTLDLIITNGIEIYISDNANVPISEHFCFCFFYLYMFAIYLSRIIDDIAETRFLDFINILLSIQCLHSQQSCERFR